MVRFSPVWLLLVTSIGLAGCGETPRAARPTRPESETPSPVATSLGTPETAEAKQEPVASEKPRQNVELVEATWADLLALVEQHKGKIVVVDLWSTACEPCMTEFPHLIELHQRFPDDVVAISFDVDYAGIKNKPPAYYRERVLEFLGSQAENKVIHRMCTTAADELFTEIKLDTIPAIYVFGRDGTILKRFDNEGVSYEKQVIPFVGNQVTASAAK